MTAVFSSWRSAFLISVSILLIPIVRSECPPPFQTVDENCYYFSYPAIADNFIQAQEYCEEMEATLAILNTEEKSKAVTDFLDTYLPNGFHFIGGYSVGHEHQYIWNGIGQRFTYTNWYTNSTGEFCTAITATANEKWIQLSCELSSYYVCQKNNNSCYDSAEATSCSRGYTLVNGKCYSFVTERSLKWIEAKEYCERRGDVLAILDTEVVNDAVTSVIAEEYSSKNFWIGAYDQSHEGTWVWDGKGTTMTYSNWIFGHPEENTLEDCLLIPEYNNTVWSSGICNTPLNFICQKLPETCTISSVPDINICSDQTKLYTSTTEPSIIINNTFHETCSHPFTVIGDGCFLLQEPSSVKFSWLEVVEVCKLMGSTIGYIFNEEEQTALFDYIKELLKNSENHSPALSSAYWLGVNKNSNKQTWFWEGIDSIANFTLWKSTAEQYRNENNCAYISGHSSSWTSARCASERFYMFCRK